MLNFTGGMKVFVALDPCDMRAEAGTLQGLNEKKSWASNVTAKAAQAVSLCLLHNLMVLFEAALAETGITNQAEEKRREKVLTERTQRVEKTDLNMPFIIAGFQRLTRRTIKFFRWLRQCLRQTHPLDVLLCIV